MSPDTASPSLLPPAGLPWFFDFISPYAYLQWRLLRRDRPDLRLDVRPVLFAGLLAHWGQLGPVEIPGKRKHTYRHVLWLARTHGLPMRFPPAHPFNPLVALRLCLAAPDRVMATELIFTQLWEEGRAVERLEDLASVAEALGLAEPAVAVAQAAVKEELAANGREAVARGIFGVPTLLIGDECFWGLDETAMALHYLADPTMLDAPMRALDELPMAVRRRV